MCGGPGRLEDRRYRAVPTAYRHGGTHTEPQPDPVVEDELTPDAVGEQGGASHRGESIALQRVVEPSEIQRVDLEGIGDGRLGRRCEREGQCDQEHTRAAYRTSAQRTSKLATSVQPPDWQPSTVQVPGAAPPARATATRSPVRAR